MSITGVHFPKYPKNAQRHLRSASFIFCPLKRREAPTVGASRGWHLFYAPFLAESQGFEPWVSYPTQHFGSPYCRGFAGVASFLCTFSGGELGIRTLGEFPHIAFRVFSSLGQYRSIHDIFWLFCPRKNGVK